MILDLTTLPARLRAADAASRDLDFEVALALGWQVQPPDDKGKRMWRDTGDGDWKIETRIHPPAFTSSWDATMAVADKSGLDWDLCCLTSQRTGGTRGVAARASRELRGDGPWWDGEPGERPLTALLAALIAALARKEWRP